MSLNHFSTHRDTAINTGSSEIIEICDSDDESKEENKMLGKIEQKMDCSGDSIVTSRTHQRSTEITEPMVKRSKLDEEGTGKINPFLKFMHQGGSGSSSANIVREIVSTHKVKKENPLPAAISSNKNKKCYEKIARMDTLTPEELGKVQAKWYAFLQKDDSIEDQRFQLLVAARLHARCQDKAVRQAMLQLRKLLEPLPFSAKTIAEADPSALQESFRNLQFYSVKSKHIVQAAKEIITQFNGQVPESECNLMKITGIGPVFADLLATINTKAAHQKWKNGEH